MYWLPLFFYMSETWALRENDIKRLITFDSKFLRRAAGYTRFDQKNNLEIVVEVKAKPVEEKLRRYKPNWLRHVERTNKKVCQK